METLYFVLAVIACAMIGGVIGGVIGILTVDDIAGKTDGAGGGGILWLLICVGGGIVSGIALPFFLR